MHSQNSILIEAQYFPPISYFSLFYHPTFDTLILEAHENYQKGSYRNRCHITNSTGMQVLSVPLLKGKNQKQPIRDVRIAYDQDWQKQHWQSIRTAYGSAPFWDYYAPMLEPFFTKKYDYLFDLNGQIIDTIFKILKLHKSINITLSNDYELNITDGWDYRHIILPRKNSFQGEKYAQIFQEKTGFLPNLSILDLILCTGTQAGEILKKSTFQ